MPPVDSQRKVFEFLKARLLSQQPFSKEELRAVTDWTKKSFSTYWSKQFKRFMAPAPGNRYRVTESFRPYLSWRKFQQHVTQVRTGAAGYTAKEYDKVLMFEFFMPLTNEQALKTTLDALFYSDIIIPKLRAVGVTELAVHIPKNAGEDDEDYFVRVSDWLNKRFVGYSMYHVAGRFRMEKLTTQASAAAIQIEGQPYLMDETTAVTRFIFPCETNEEVIKVRFFFECLFMRSIIQLVNAEAEIWLVESGVRNRVFVWSVNQDAAVDDEDEEDESGSTGSLLT